MPLRIFFRSVRSLNIFTNPIQFPLLSLNGNVRPNVKNLLLSFFKCHISSIDLPSLSAISVSFTGTLLRISSSTKIIVTGLPIASFSVYPGNLSEPAFQLVILFSLSIVKMAKSYRLSTFLVCYGYMT